MSTSPSNVSSSSNVIEKNLNNILGWLQKDDYVVIQNNESYIYFFHKCLSDQKNPVQIEKFFKDHDVVYFDIASCSILLDNFSWVSIITNAGFQECTCNLKDRVSNQNSIPNRGYFTSV